MNENALTIDIAPPVGFESVNVPFMMLPILYPRSALDKQI